MYRLQQNLNYYSNLKHLNLGIVYIKDLKEAQDFYAVIVLKKSNWSLLINKLIRRWELLSF